jgi:hypothetical protein
VHLTNREIWALVHGLVLGGMLLLGSTAVLVALAGLRSEHLTAAGIRSRVMQVRIGATVTAAAAWAIALIGTWVVLPWYREDTPDSPRTLLLSDPHTRQWHEFADVWKTHVAYISPILATAAAALVVYYGGSLARDRAIRNIVLALFVGGFAVALVAALVGSLVTRAAPIR